MYRTMFLRNSTPSFLMMSHLYKFITNVNYSMFQKYNHFADGAQIESIDFFTSAI